MWYRMHSKVMELAVTSLSTGPLVHLAAAPIVFLVFSQKDFLWFIYKCR